MKINNIKKHPLCSVWKDMKRRCYNETRAAYKNYGGRGIKVCDEWLNNYELFYNWSIKAGWQPGLTIDRKDVNGHYEPTNCRFVTKSVNSKENKTTSVFITYEGKTMTLTDWAIYLNISYSTLYFRVIVYKIPLDKAFQKVSLRVPAADFKKKDTKIEKFHWTDDLLRLKKSDELMYKDSNNIPLLMANKMEFKPLKDATIEFEYMYLTCAIDSVMGQLTKAAKLLGVDRKTMYNKISQFENLCAQNKSI